MTGAELEALAKRVEGARGADSTLDVAVWCAVKEGWEVAERDADSVQCVGLSRWTRLPPAYMASVDAVLELISEVLPGWSVDALCDRQEFIEAGDWRGAVRSDVTCNVVNGFAATPALALLAATLRALAQQAAEARERGE